jgi:hypothetical protein
LLIDAMMALLPSNNGFVAPPRSRSTICKPLCAFKTAPKTSKTTRNGNKRSVTLSPPDPEAVASSTPYLALTGFSALAGSALTLAPQTVWELLGSRDVVDVTLTSSELGTLRM